MRKKFFAMYALVGALVASPVFTSCIDDTESASVTAVRTQKAEAMRIANQIAAATVEMQIEANKLKYEKDIADYKQSIANYEALLLQYQKTIKENQAKLDNYGKVELSTLTSAYTTALSNVTTTEWNIIKINQQIKGLKEGYLSAEETLAGQIETQNGYIATAQAKIDQLNEWIENGAIDEIELNNQISELSKTQQKLYNDWKLLEAEYGNFELDRNVPTGKYEWNDENGDGIQDADEFEEIYDYNGEAKLATVKAARKLKNLSSNYITTDAEGYLILSETNTAAMKTTAISNLETAEKTLADALKELGTEADTEKTTYTEADEITKTPTLYAELALANKNMTAADALLAKLEKALADAKAALETENAKETPDATKVGELEGKVTAALNLLNGYKADTAEESLTDYDDNAETKEMGYAYAKNELTNAESSVLTAKDNIVIYENNVAYYKEIAENIDAWIAAFSGDDYAAYKEAKDAIEDAYKAWQLAYTEESALSQLKGGLNKNNANISVDGKSLTFAEAIEYYEARIEGYKEAIAELKNAYKYNHNGTNIDANTEEALAILVAYFEKQLESEEYMLAIYEKAAEEAKAALDAYLAE